MAVRFAVLHLETLSSLLHSETFLTSCIRCKLHAGTLQPPLMRCQVWVATRYTYFPYQRLYSLTKTPSTCNLRAILVPISIYPQQRVVQV
ncbi:hypothetical protein BGW80DRAFT_1267492 [Lactifluus volemus]|nr:hypothetical protein BGW80DRAFT_1267492 [Lactifluus volemus]